MIGILSDSHDNLEAIDRAVRFFNRKKVSMVIHAGDYNAPFVVERLKKLKMPVVGVFGNVDGERVGLNKKFSELGARLSDFLELKQSGKNIAVYHGKDPKILNAVINSKKYDIVITGHTHRPEVKTVGNVLIINSGEICGYLTGKSTVALLNVKELKAEIHEI